MAQYKSSIPTQPRQPSSPSGDAARQIEPRNPTIGPAKASNRIQKTRIQMPRLMPASDRGSKR